MIQIKDLSKSFDRDIIKDFNLTFEKEKTSVILGPSGCGKTTLFNILSGLDKDYRGSIEIDDKVSYIFQEDRLIPWLDIEENLNLVMDKKEDRKKDKILQKFHLEHRKGILAKDLSGGEKQRLSIARAFAHNTNTILMDEALRSLDLSLKLKVIREINDALDEYKKTMVVISHDIREALLLADKIYVLDKNPMTIKEEIEVSIPKKERKLYNENLLEVERRLYTLLLK